MAVIKRTNVKSKPSSGKVSASQYVRNVGKSVAFITIKALGENSEGIKDFLKENDEFFKETYASVKNFRSNLKNSTSTIKDNKLFQALEYGVKNIIEDVKTGQFYDHRDDDSASALGLGDDDEYNWGDNWDEDNADYDTSSSSSISSSTKALTDSFSKSMAEASNMQSTVVAKGIGMVVKGQEASTKYLMAQMDKVGQNIHAGLGSVYVEVNTVNKYLQGPMMSHLENSKTYYENSIRIMQEQHQMIKEMLDMQKSVYKKNERGYDNSSSALDNIFRAGSFNIKEYFENVKKNTKQLIDDFTGGALNFDFGGGSNPLMLMMSNPVGLLIEQVADSLFPKRFSKALKSFDKSVSNMFAQAIAKINKAKGDTTNGFLEVLFEILGVDVEKRTGINTARYERGAVPFDGIVRKSIVDVIPGYLSRIEAALTGNEQRHYDYNTGSWKDARRIKAEFDYEKNGLVARANYDLRQEMERLASKTEAYDKNKANRIRKTADYMINRIFEDGGDFRKRKKSGKLDYEYYGNKYLSEKEYDDLIGLISNDALKTIALENMQARQDYSRKLKEFESGDNLYRILYDDTYRTDAKSRGQLADPSKYKFNGSGILAASHDGSGKNIFQYLKEIISAIKTKSVGGTAGRYRARPRSASTGATAVGGSSSGETSSESSGDDPDPDGEEIPWDQFYKDKEKAEQEQDSSTGKKFRKWISEKFGNSPFGKLLQSTLGLGVTLLEKPFNLAADLLEKADNSIMGLMFGENELRDKDGNKINSVFEYIVTKVKETFIDLKNWIKDTFKKNIWEPVKNYIKPRWEKYGKPMVDEAKDLFKSGKNRVKEGLNNTFGTAFGYVKDNLQKGNVVDADSAEAAKAAEDGTIPIGESARGRLVTKRGLTMISPGEIIIPASFDKKEQDRMLALEKRDKNRIINAIGFNARGNVDTSQMRDQLSKIYKESKEHWPRIGGGGIIGAGAGLLAGLNPLLGAAAGAGLTILSHSDTAKNILFGKDLGNGERDGGIISKDIYGKIKKAIPDMADFGIAGGVLGLFTPFGLLGGAAIGAGVGLLKNNESFKKFLFGENESDGLISKESVTKVKDFIKKAAPNVAVGTVAGVFTGPFGLLGNAALGASAGLLSATPLVHKLIFGDKDGEDEDLFSDGLVGAIKNGILIPAKDKFFEIATITKDKIKENVIEPLKDFWSPFKQTIKNTISNVGYAIKDSIVNMVDKSLGTPLGIFLQEKVFKPVTNIAGKILKLPLKAAGAVAFAPFKAAGALGRHMQRNLIRTGQGFNMRASDRIQYMKDHPGLKRWKNNNYLEQDEFINDLSDDKLSELYANVSANISGYEQLKKQSIKSKSKVNSQTFDFFKKNIGFDRVDSKKVEKLSKFIQNGESEKAREYLNKLGLDDAEKQNFLEYIDTYSRNNEQSLKNMATAESGDEAIDTYLREAFGGRFDDPKSRRRIRNALRAEIKHRGISSDLVSTKEQTPESKAIDELKIVQETKTDEVIRLFKTANSYLAKILNIEEKDDSKKEGQPSVAGHFDPETGLTATGDPDAKADKAIREEAERDDKTQEDQLEETKKGNELAEKLNDVLLGSQEEKKEGILSKIWGGIKTVFKYIGGGAAVLGGVSLFGHATEWFKNTIWPPMKGVLIGTKEEPGLFWNIANFFEEKFNKIKTWWNNEGGLSGVLGNHVITPLIAGLGYTIDNVVAPLTAALIKYLPKILIGVGKGIVKGIFSFKDNDSIDDANFAVGSTESEALNEINKTVKKHNTTSGKFVPESVKQMYPSDSYNYSSSYSSSSSSGSSTTPSSNYKSSASSTIVSSAQKEQASKISNKTPFSISGLLGQTKRTNDVVYTEDGTRVSDYTRLNESNSVASTLWRQANENFARAALGGNMPIKGITSALKNINLSKNVKKIFTSKSGWGKAWNAAMTGAKGLGKVFGTVTAGADDAGHFINTTLSNAIKKAKGETVENAVENVVENAASSSSRLAKMIESPIKQASEAVTENIAKEVAENAAEEAAEQAAKGTASVLLETVKSKIKNAFEELADGTVGKLVKNAAKKSGKEVSESKVKKMFKELAEKVCKSAVGKAGSKVIAKLASSWVNIAFAAMDFIWGYDNAESIFGVTANNSYYEINIGHRIIAGLANMIREMLLGLISIDTLSWIISDVIMPFLGMDTEALKNAQAEAKEILDAWNLANPDNTFDNLQDYNNRNKWYTKVKNWFKDRQEKAADAINEATNGDYNKVKDQANNLFKGKVVWGFGRGRSSKQDDSIFANMPYGDSTIGEAGCGPVSVVNLLRNMGKNANVINAANYAETNGYTTPGGGTDIGYFDSYLRANGVSSKTTTNKSDILNALARGNNVILLGKDSSNAAGSPFGMNPHYITATGIDSNGNIIVEDPDLPQNSVKYSKSKLLNSTMASVIAGGNRFSGKGSAVVLDSGQTAADATTAETEEEKPSLASSLTAWIGELGRKIYGDRYGMLFGSSDSQTSSSSNKGALENYYTSSKSTNSSSSSSPSSSSEKFAGARGSVIWSMLKNLGYTPEGIAGIMGNLYAESGLTSNNLENVYNQKFALTDDEYTEKVNNKIRNKSSFVNDSAGYGLAQWTYNTRKKGLYERTVEQGKSISNAEEQIKYLDYELQNEPSFRSLYNLLTTTKDINKASDQFLVQFERPAYKNYDQRRSYSQNMYDSYSGSGRYSKYSGQATRSLSGGANAAARYSYIQPTTSAPTVDYNTFLQTIVTILMSIADNTAILSKILEVLSEKLNLNIDQNQVKEAAREKNKTARNALTKVLSNAGNGNIEDLNTSSIRYLLNAMTAIANE